MVTYAQPAIPNEELWELAVRYRDDWLGFAQRLIQTPSLPGDESAVACIIQSEMHALGYERVWTDKVGNVIGWLRGEGGRPLMFNGHMDIVDPGNADEWPHPPYAGHVDAEWLWGRGASDMKAALALEVYAPALLRRAGIPLPGDCYVTAVVFEETGGLGTRTLAGELKADVAVVGEATSNQIARGHRGRLEVLVHIKGRSVHASVPERGANPHYSMARFLSALRGMEMTPSADFGSSSVAPTLYRTDQCSANVIPGEAVLYLDWRNVPEETPQDVIDSLQNILDGCLEDGCEGHVALNVTHFHAYTGYEETLPREFPGFVLAPDHPLIAQAKEVLEHRFGHEVDVIKWRFATDGAYLVNAGIPTIGFAPASDLYPHTTGDRIALDAMAKGLVGYMALALELGQV